MYNFFRSICLILFFLQNAVADHASAQTATESAMQLPKPVRIKFSKGETAFTLKDHLAVGETSKRYVLKALAGQIMRVLNSTEWIHLEILGQDGTVVTSQNDNPFGFWLGELPSTQDYFIKLTRESAKKDEDFMLYILVNPVGQVTRWLTLQDLWEQRPVNLFPNQYDSGAHDSNVYVPSSYHHLLSIPFHSSGKVLRVYSNKPCSFDPLATDGGVVVRGINIARCVSYDNEVRLAYYDPTRRISTYLGAIQTVSSGNSGGIFMPFALTKDDCNIILDAWMGSPGAGGGMADYGYAMIPLKAASESTVYSDVAQIATRDAFFYDNYGKVVYLGNSDKMPQYQQPGPRYNNGALFLFDLITNKKSIILEEANTTFDLVAIDVRAKRIILTATKYQFTEACPKDEEGYYCAEKTTTARTIPLP